MLIAITVVVFAVYVVDWLSAADPPRSADFIVVLSGAPERALYAADLFANRLAPRVLVSRPAANAHAAILEQIGLKPYREEVTNRLILEKKGVPPDAITYFGDGSISTVQELEVLSMLFTDQRTSLLIVTSPHHVLRVRLTARQILPTERIGVAVVATPYENLPRNWWADQEAARNVLLECAKTLFLMLGGRYRSGHDAS